MCVCVCVCVCLRVCACVRACLRVCVFVLGPFNSFCNVVLSAISRLQAISSFAVILLRKREPVALLKLCSGCQVAVRVPCLFLPQPHFGL